MEDFIEHGSIPLPIASAEMTGEPLRMQILVATENGHHARHIRRQALKWEKKFPFVKFIVLAVGDATLGYKADMLINLVDFNPRTEHKMAWLETFYHRVTPHCVIIER